MKIIKEIAGRIFALWALLVFVLTMLIFLIPGLIISGSPDPGRTYKFIAFARIWMRIFLTATGCPLRVKGKEHFKPGRNYIVLFNHNSFMDVPVSSPFTPGGNKTIAKIELSRLPVFGMFYKMGSVMVDRKSEASRRESFTKMRAVLEMGLHICIYPEGTRNKSEEPLKAFKNGAFRLAIDSGKPVIPALIFNTRATLPADKFFYMMPHRLKLHFLEAVTAREGESADALRERVFGLMKDYYMRCEV